MYYSTLTRLVLAKRTRDDLSNLLAKHNIQMPLDATVKEEQHPPATLYTIARKDVGVVILVQPNEHIVGITLANGTKDTIVWPD